jgi:hypothetical protein
MSSVISENGQTRYKNGYASSSEAKLTLRVNGEEEAVVITPSGSVVQAGFDAPTAAAVISDGGAGSVPEGYYVYRYCYASSRYPFVANDVTAGGEEWPRSSPSDSSNTLQVTGGTRQVTVQVTYTTRSDVDWIFIYRTSAQTTAANAEAQDAAGNLFYVGRLANNTAGGTGTFTDNEVADTTEAMDLDNYVCPLFRLTLFDGFYWWGFGNTVLTTVVTLDGTTTFSIDTAQSDVDAWFSGRDGYTINFYGITTGGYDGRGNYYFKRVTATTGQAFVGSDLVTPATIPATGTTTAYLTAPSTTLYRSKRLNPFSWGFTEVTNTNIQIPQLFALRIGGGIGTGLALIPNERILKLDTEGPQKSFALDLNAADDPAFLSTLRTLDEAQSTSSQYSQFPMRDANGLTVLASVNAKAFQFLTADGQSQIPIGDNVRETLARMVNDGTNPDFYHGFYDYRTELNCFCIKTSDSPFACDTMIFQHAPTGKWGMRSVPLSASATIYDPVERDHFTIVGNEGGQLGIMFAEGEVWDWFDTSNDNEGGFGTLNADAGTLDVQYFANMPDLVIANGTATGTINGATIEVGTLVYATGADLLTPIPLIVESILDTVYYTFRSPELLDLATTTAYLIHPINQIASVLVETTTLQSVYARKVYMAVFPMSALTFSSFSLPNITFTVGAVSGINADSGAYETISGAYTFHLGVTHCSARRYFNGGTPDREKKKTEVIATIAGFFSYVRYFTGYSETASAYGELIAATGTNKHQHQKPPADFTPAFGVDIHNVIAGPFTLYDLTVNAK